MKHQVDALTATRGFAALLVVIFHFGCTVWPFSLFEHFFRSGNLAVGYFFVLSGFVMYYTYHSRQIHTGRFISKRVARIAPAYYVALILAVVWLLITGKINWLHVLLNAIFTQAFFPGYALTVNSPGWSLSIEMFFYVLFPVLLSFAVKKPKAFIGFAILFYMLSQVLHLWMVNTYRPVYGTAIHEFIFYFPLFHLNEFLIGMAGGYFFFTHKKDIKHPSLIPLVAIILLVNFVPSGISLHNGLLAPLYALLILAVAINNSSVLRFTPFVFLGEVSYGIYILQEPLYHYAAKANENYVHLGESAFFYAYCLLLIFCAALSYYMVEKPLRNMMNRP